MCGSGPTNFNGQAPTVAARLPYPPFPTPHHTHPTSLHFDFYLDVIVQPFNRIFLSDGRNRSRGELDSLVPAPLSHIFTHLNPERLEEIFIGETAHESIQVPDASDPIESYVVDGSAVLALVPFSNLVNVFLQSGAGFAIEDNTLRQLLPAWPRLERLRLDSGSNMQVPPKTTLFALYALAKHCPALERSTQRTLTYYDSDFQEPPIEQPLEVAAFLSGVFPSLRQLVTRYTDEGYWYDDEESDGETMEVVSRMRRR
ncbi:hypothetical protein MKEN_01117900 [Mycena kentingensis (nom. inval.)]|nr:hypothetical protein MKEN_01117900 [Mycena kentingensis (nom. inval.)]